MNRTIVAHTPFGSTALFKKMTGFESVSDLFEYSITLVSQNPNLQGRDIIGQLMTLQINTQSNSDRFLNGLVTDFGYAREDADEEGYYAYSCIMRPLLWYLTQNIDSRVFVEKNVVDIAHEILASFGLPYQIQCQKSYRKRGFCTQYQESSFVFLSRLFEQEGIYYYFKHSNDTHELVITDDISTLHTVIAPMTLPYHSRQIAPGEPSHAYIDEWFERDSLKTSQFITQEYSYRNAKVPMQSNSMVHEFNGVTTEHYDFYTGFADAAEAQNYSQIRSESLKVQTKHIQAAGTALNIAPGFTFELNKHPHLTSNTSYVILSANYDFEEAGYTTGNQIGKFRIAFQALPKTFAYRPPLRTPKPNIVGTQAAVVTGPAGEEVYTNEYGDIKIQFHWDRYGKHDENSSGWVRVAQGSAGAGFGSINTPRIGEEVLVDFINGDVDRPIVSGRLYNSAMTPPWGFPSAAKQSGIKSKSFNSPLANFNELMFDDTAGAERVNFQAQKDLTSLIKNNETRNVNQDRTTTIGNNETVTVVGERNETVQKNETIAIVQNRTETVGEDESISIAKNQSLNVGKNQSVSVGENQSISVVQNRSRSVGQNESVGIGASQAINIKNDQSIGIGKNQALTIGANRNKTVLANEVSQIGGNRSQTVSLNGINNVGIAQMTNIGLGYMLNVGAGWMTNVGAAEMHNVALSMGIHAGKSIGLNAGQNITLSANKKITLQVGNSVIIIESNQISIVSKKIKMVGTKKMDLSGKKVDIN